MPSYSKRNAATQNANNYRTRFFVYQPRKGVSSTGGVIRGPEGVGKPAGSAPPAEEILWTDYGEVLDYGGADRAVELREASTMLWTIECRWGRNKPYVAGMMIFIPGSGESFQVNSVGILETKFKKFLLTCRTVL